MTTLHGAEAKAYGELVVREALEDEPVLIVTTAESIYRLEPATMTVVRTPRRGVTLRADGERIPVLGWIEPQVGFRWVLLLTDLAESGDTVRSTTTVVSITRQPEE